MGIMILTYSQGINTICGKNNQLSSHNWLVKFAEDTNQQFEIRTDKITSIRTGKSFRLAPISVTDVGDGC